MSAVPGPVSEIQMAKSDAEVVSAVASYLGSILPSEFEVLPADCRIFTVDSAEEIVDAAVTLTSSELRVAHDHESSDLLRSMVRVFTAASHRITRMHNPLNAGQ